MKHIIILMCIALCSSLKAQPKVSCSTAALTGSSVTLDITTNDFTDIEGFQFSIDYDVSKLQFTGHLNQATSINTNEASPGKIIVLSAYFGTLNMANGGVLLSLSFNVLDSGCSFGVSITDDPQPRRYVFNDVEYVLDSKNGLVVSPTFTGLPINLTMLLEGPYNSVTGLMETNLINNGHLSTISPYSDQLALSFPVTNSVYADVVDWVEIGLKDASDPAKVILFGSGLLKANGQVVGRDGSSPVSLFAPCGDYIVVINHRNHLWTQTAGTINFSNQLTTVDFKTVALSNTTSFKLINNQQMLRAGDVDNDDFIGSGDRSKIWNKRNAIGYYPEDVSLDGVVSSADRNLCWNNRNNTSQ